jgi:alkylation response protein AidB-like acyl-CoA dehydrogenase
MTTVHDVDTAAGLPQKARDLFPLLDESAAQADAQGRLTDDVVDALHRERLWGMWVPQPLGGSELDPVSSLEVIESLAYGDPSVAWVLMAASLAIGTGGAYLGDDAAEELFAGGRLPVIVGQGTRPGTARSQDGGFLLSGQWSFASGIKHATHIHTLAIIEETGEPRIFVLPVGQATLVDNWDVLGLRATGSIDYTIDGVFVPESYTHFATSETPGRGGALYHIGIPGFAAICHTGWALGLGRRLLDELAALARKKAGRPGAQGESADFLSGYEQAEGRYRAARALAFETWRDAWDALVGRPPLRPPAVADPPHDHPRHLGRPRGRHLRLPRRRDDRTALRHHPAALPRPACGDAAHDRLAARPPDRRAGARRPRRWEGLALHGVGRPGIGNSSRAWYGPG